MSAYLDHNATSPVRPDVIQAIADALGVIGNPSSVHGAGRSARRLLEESREAIAAFVGAEPSGVIFTSGGSEANALALSGLGRKTVIASAIEHPSVLKAAQCHVLPVNGDGVAELQALEKLLANLGGRDALVSVMLANNETGVVQPVAELTRIAHAHGALVHCDAVQAAGKLDLDIKALGVDCLSLSAHKLGGPQGVGALVLADPNIDVSPLIKGGGQERSHRAGTENLSGIAGFAAAVRTVEDGGAERMAVLRDGLECALLNAVPGLTIFGRNVDRLPNTSCLAVPGLTAQTAVMALDLAGVMVSAGSACSSGKVAPSHVLTAMGAGALAGAAVRVSLGWNSTAADVDAFVEAFTALARRHEIQDAATAA
ncbi:MAG TPA: cysteine desulfurase family protein [Candidatus Sulfotelmatobacter sp.]|jgi:cysteine desulfurase|nr:cysteine desulfurase family protein [Candidatus Sulfotelmatobacter sp.]